MGRCETFKNCYRTLTWGKLTIGLSITSGLKYLHELEIIHKDLVLYLRNVILLHKTNNAIDNIDHSFAFTTCTIFSVPIIFLSVEAALLR